MNLAIAFFDITNLSGGGGAERFFYDFFTDYIKHPSAKHKMIMVTDGTENIEKSGRAVVKESTVYLLNYRYYNFRVFNFLNRRPSFLLGNFINALQLFRVVRKNKIDKLIVPFYHPREFSFYRTLNRLGIELDYFIVDCRIPDNYQSNAAPYYFKDCYQRFFEKIQFNNIHTWYQSVEHFVAKNGVIKNYRKIHSYKSRYSRIKIDYNPSLKKNILVYAARMDQQKDPLFFLNAIKILHERNNLGTLKILMFGEGPLLDQVKQFITNNGLTMVQLMISGNLESVFAESRIFVSTQMYENFPSLAISEAMSKGNLIIAKNVGQTHYLVRDGENGFLCDETKAESLADCILKAVTLSETETDKMAKKSVAIMSHEHTREKFIAQFDELVL